MTSERNRDYAKTLLSRVRENSGELSPDDGFSPLTSVARIMRRQYWEHIEHLFDMLPIVWGLETSEFERLLGVAPGWLDAYRIHEVKPNEEIWDQLDQLLLLHLAMRMAVESRGYAEWLRRPWTTESAIGEKSPLELLLSGGNDALTSLKQICLAQTQ